MRQHSFVRVVGTHFCVRTCTSSKLTSETTVYDLDNHSLKVRTELPAEGKEDFSSSWKDISALYYRRTKHLPITE